MSSTLDKFEQDLLTRIATTFGVTKGARLMVGVSGGPDSVALLLGLSNISKSLNIEVLATHVNHGIRGAESDRDQDFVEKLCQKIGVNCQSLQVSGIKSKGNLEDQLRQQRYRLLFQEADRCGAILLTAHHAEDQAETVLFKIVRGSGPKGWAGISPEFRDPPTGVLMIRPLLNERRQNILAYLDRCEANFCTDSTNQSVDLDRNWIRLSLLPQIASRLNPKVVEALGRAAQISRELAELLDHVSKEAFPVICEISSDDCLTLKAEELRKLPAALQRLIIRRAITTLRPDNRQIRYGATDDVLGLLSAQSGRRLNLPRGLVACREPRAITIRNLVPLSPFCEPLEIPGNAWIESRGLRIKGDWIKQSEEDSPYSQPTFLWEGSPLSLRSRKSGDVFCSRKGRSRKLKDLLSEEQISSFERDRLIVISTEQEIIWVENLWVRPSLLPRLGQEAVGIAFEKKNSQPRPRLKQSSGKRS
jgi:tRNA(Ile)-lysidine synthase